MTNTKITFAALLSTLMGCGGSVWTDLDWAEFDTPVTVSEIELSQLNLADQGVTYFEIRNAYNYDATCVSFYVRTSIGDKCSGAPDVEICETEFDAMTLDGTPRCEGDALFLLNSRSIQDPVMMPDYTMLAINRGTENDFVEYSSEALISLFGSIDTEAEASLFLSSEGYYWDSENIEDGAIRPVDDGYEFITTRITSYCDPIESERVLLHLHADGEIEELRSQVNYREYGHCAMY